MNLCFRIEQRKGKKNKSIDKCRKEKIKIEWAGQKRAGQGRTQEGMAGQNKRRKGMRKEGMAGQDMT